MKHTSTNFFAGIISRLDSLIDKDESLTYALLQAKCIVQDECIKYLLAAADECAAKREERDSTPPGPADATAHVTLANAKRARASRVNGEDILSYLWERDGSTRFEYIVRDLFSNNIHGKLNAESSLCRLEKLGDVSIDREGRHMVVVTARRMPKD